MRMKQVVLTLYTRMVDSKTKPISVAIIRCQIINVQIHRHGSTVLSADTLSAQHSCLLVAAFTEYTAYMAVALSLPLYKDEEE